MERLTKRDGLIVKTVFESDFGTQNILNRLADYEDLEEQGYKMVNTDKVVEQLLKNAYKVTEKNTNLEHAVIGLIDVIKIVKGGAK